YWWVISDQGSGFAPPTSCQSGCAEHLPHDEKECGRGLYILYQVFDQVHWNAAGTELRLCKEVSNRFRLPLVR
ncbi:MAG TPA: ATP-binding protein, partial [Candidatus Obscuribacterales bacterium]